jgi:HEPN domain-containing protein
MSVPEQAKMMQALAAKDIKAMRSLIDPDSADDEIFGFHAQQAVEKSLKAWIIFAGGSYGRIHDLQQLFLILQDLGCNIKQFENLIELNPFAVQMLYDLFYSDEPTLDRSEILRRVVEFYDHVQQILD